MQEAADAAAPEVAAQAEAEEEPTQAPAPAARKKAPKAPGKGPSQVPSKPVAAEGNGMGAEALLSCMEGMQKKLLTQLTAAQATTLKGLREDMRKETKLIEAATLAQVHPANLLASASLHSEHTCLVKGAVHTVPCECRVCGVPYVSGVGVTVLLAIGR